MNDMSVESLLVLLLILIICSAFFSSSETGMMTLNRYRLRHLAQQNHRAAQRAQRLLERPDRLIGIILIGNNFVNILASSVATIIAIRIWGDAGIAIATALLTLVILIFAEVTPKTIAALYPERIAFPATLILRPLLVLMYPLVWAVNLLSNGLIKLLRIDASAIGSDHLSREELRTLVHEAGTRIPKQHRQMLLSILDLEKVSVEDIMVPRSDINGIDLEDDLDEIVEQLKTSQHTRLPVYKGDINNILGILHLRNLGRFLTHEFSNKAMLLQHSRDAYFIPHKTSLNTQLLNFQKEQRRIGIVVDEYGDVLGLATLEDILEEIVGEFTTDVANTSPEITLFDDERVLLDASATVRKINKLLGWKLPINGPKTLNGLILEALENIPDNPVCLVLHGYRLEIKQIKDNAIKSVLALRNQ
ncbi:HlyC/CorC family transporter [Allohahella marinimesophila]|uniref:HlyC/CorC family transporter n=2 Tax=Allohahella marinimesophila TaxID=1054972 RepID=A0ABP7Q4S5_9GAMM